MINNADHLVVEVNLVFGRMLVVLDSTDLTRSYMWSESSLKAELRLRSGLLKLLQLVPCCLEQSSNFVSDFFWLELVTGDFVG
jgi:hypothetical protein